MDRIHSAIAKARAKRTGIDTNNVANVASSQEEPKRDVNWTILREFQISADVFDRNHIVAHQANEAAAPFDVMRTALLHQVQTHGWTRVAITSPDAGCGKTTVTLNLAFSLARMSDLRVMVLELDLRRPAMVRVLGIDRKMAFASVLDGKDAPETQLIRFGSNLAFGMSSSPISSPAELLSSVRAASIVDVIEANYRPDIILFDMPPMMAGDDTLAFLDQVDCALMITAAEETPINLIDQCGKDLADRTQVLGVVLNKCRMIDPQDMY